MEKSHQMIRLAANQAGGVASFQEKERVRRARSELGGNRGNLARIFLSTLGILFFLTGCGEQAPGPGANAAAEAKSAAPAVPEEGQGAAQGLSRPQTHALLFG